MLDVVILAIAAPFVGSFLGLLIVRLPRDEAVVLGRSRCESCGRRLAVADLVPVVSWLASRGRCRHCGVAIGALYPLIEVAALVVVLWAGAIVDGVLLWATCLLGWALLTLAVIDWRTFLLPDVLTLPLIAAGLAVAAWIGEAALAAHATGAAAGFLFALMVRAAYRRLRNREGLGFGDAKLLAAAGAWVSWTGLPTVLLLAALAGLAVAGVGGLRRGEIDWQSRVPFGTYLCAAIWLVWLYGPLRLQ